MPYALSLRPELIRQSFEESMNIPIGSPGDNPCQGFNIGCDDSKNGNFEELWFTTEVI